MSNTTNSTNMMKSAMQTFVNEKITDDHVMNMTSQELHDLCEPVWKIIYSDEELRPRPVRIQRANDSLDIEYADVKIRMEDTGELVWVFSDEVQLLYQQSPSSLALATEGSSARLGYKKVHFSADTKTHDGLVAEHQILDRLVTDFFSSKLKNTSDVLGAFSFDELDKMEDVFELLEKMIARAQNTDEGVPILPHGGGRVGLVTYDRHGEWLYLLADIVRDVIETRSCRCAWGMVTGGPPCPCGKVYIVGPEERD